ncbi:MFS transporter [Streptococcus sp. zg-JUN1979]|uniref:MFS transporter n=1 Tax=Streptococcus sp. zg-JUN1979 TaxID=3391450 RepID=UPI0039A52F4B
MKKQLEKLSLLSLSLILVSTLSPSAALPQMISDFARQGISASQVEFLFSLSSFAVLVMLLIAPWMARYLSEKVMIITGLLLVAFGGSLPLLFQSYGLVYFSRILLGFGLGFINARAISIISENYRGSERVQMLGIRGSFEILGNALLTAICGFLVTFGWSKAFAVYLFALLILLFYLLFAPKKEKTSQAQDVQDVVKGKLGKQHLSLVIGLSILAGFAINVNSANSLRIPVVIVDNNLGSASQASVILSLMMLVGIISGLLFSYLDKVLKEHLLPFSFFLLGASLMLMGMATTLWLLTLGAMLANFSYSIIVTATFSKTSEALPANLIASATTLILVFCILGGATSSFVLSFFSRFSPVKSTAFLIYAGVSIGIALLLLARRFVVKKEMSLD